MEFSELQVSDVCLLNVFEACKRKFSSNHKIRVVWRCVIGLHVMVMHAKFLFELSLPKTKREVTGEAVAGRCD